MKRRDVLRAGAAMALGAASVGAPRGVLAQRKLVFKASDVHPAGYPTVVAVERMGKKLEAATDGRLSVQMYAAMQLGGEKEAIEQAQIGDELLAKVTDNPQTRLIGLCWMDAGARSMYDTKQPIRSIDDLKGLKVRVMGNPMFVDMMNALGGNGVAMGYDQVFSALQTGVVDGAENNPPSFVFDNHYQVAKFYTLTEHLIVPEIIVFSRRTWDTLSKDDQELIRKFSKEAQSEERTLWAAYEKEAFDKMRAAGVDIITVADRQRFKDAVKPVWDKYGTKYAALVKRIQDVP